MLVGESGTGKEVAAQLLHAHSARAGGPFVSVNCGAIPANLVEAELFGYERGAFTGAVRQHPGLFRARVRRNAVPGRDHRDADRPAGEAPARARKRAHGSHRRDGGDPHRRPHRDGDESSVRRGRPRSAACAKTSSTGWPSSWSACRRCAGGAPTSSSWRTRSWRSSIGKTGRRSGSIGARWPSPRPIRGPAMSASSRIASSAATCCRTTLVKLDVQPAPEAFDSDLDSGDCVRLPIGITMADAERELLLATLRHCGGNKRRTADVLGVSLKTVYNKLVGVRQSPRRCCARPAATRNTDALAAGLQSGTAHAGDSGVRSRAVRGPGRGLVHVRALKVRRWFRFDDRRSASGIRRR